MSSAPLALLVLQEDFSDCVHCFLSVVSISNYNFNQGMAVQRSLLDCHAIEPRSTGRLCSAYFREVGMGREAHRLGY
jgi:hypothetical protein